MLPSVARKDIVVGRSELKVAVMARREVIGDTYALKRSLSRSGNFTGGGS